MTSKINDTTAAHIELKHADPIYRAASRTEMGARNYAIRVRARGAVYKTTSKWGVFDVIWQEKPPIVKVTPENKRDLEETVLAFFSGRCKSATVTVRPWTGFSWQK